MRDFLIRVLGAKEGSVEIGLFSIWHILYIVLIAVACGLCAFLLKNRKQKTQRMFLNVLAIATLVFYIIDFFLQPFVTSDHNLNIDKLPFHICTLMSIVAVFAQFSHREWFKEVSVILAMTGALMYLVYPGTALGGVSPWCYRVVQTMLYHGMLFAWGFLSLTTGQVKLHYKNIWMPLVGLVLIALWAALGNWCYVDYNWFFLKGVSGWDFLPKSIMPILVVVAVYSVSACLYLIYFICETIKKKHQQKMQSDEMKEKLVMKRIFKVLGK